MEADEQFVNVRAIERKTLLPYLLCAAILNTDICLTVALDLIYNDYLSMHEVVVYVV